MLFLLGLLIQIPSAAQAAAIEGRVTIEGFASVGTNATVLPDLTVGSGALFAGLIVFTPVLATGLREPFV